MTVRPSTGRAEVQVLHEGYVSPRTSSTVALIRDGGATIVWDPGMVPSPASILDPLRALGVGPVDVSDVILSHHHPDHTMNVGLFPAARVHDHWAWYRGDEWVDRDCEGFEVSPSVALTRTPGHSPECLTVLAETADGLVALTHLWWDSEGPAVDPRATDPAGLEGERTRILKIADVIVPGHGAMFRPLGQTPG